MVILCVWGGSFRPSENGGIITACMRYGFALCQKRAGGAYVVLLCCLFLGADVD